MLKAVAAQVIQQYVGLVVESFESTNVFAMHGFVDVFSKTKNESNRTR